MATKYYAAEPLFLTLSHHSGPLLYGEIIWNIMRLLLMSYGNGEWDSMDAENALEELDEILMEQFDKLKEEAEKEYSSPEFQEYLERIHLYPGTVNAPKLQPVEELLTDEDDKSPLSEEIVKERLMAALDEYDWQGFCLWKL